VVVVQNGGLGNVAVWIERGLEQFTFAPPAQPAQMDNHNCLFEPRVVVVSVHGLVRFTSSDPVAHNVRWSGGNHSLPYKGSSTQAAFCSPGIEKVACDVHSWMRGYVVVAPTPYAAVSAPDGAFAFDRPLPPGTYTLVAWHETLGRKTVEVTLADGETREVVIPFP
jgi:plastocyanin